MMFLLKSHHWGLERRKHEFVFLMVDDSSVLKNTLINIDKLF